MSSRRARGGRWRTDNSRPFKHHLPPDRELTTGLYPDPVRAIERPKVAAEDGEIVMKNMQYLGSYNWTNSTPATIIVPGSPPVWRDRPLPYTVEADTDAYFIDQNGFRMPSSALLPLFKSVDSVARGENQPDIDWSSVDFVTDRNNLKKLLRWINSDGKGEFRVDTQLAGRRTVLFDRWEKCTREAPGWKYGHNFGKASTTPAPGCKLGTGHHRIITYDINGLKIVVRFEVDACLPRAVEPAKATSNTVDQLTESLSVVSISSQSPALPRNPTSEIPLLIIKGGSKLPQSALIKLQTRSETSKRVVDWQESYPRLFLTQMDHHFLGVHSRGRFHTCEKREMALDLDNIFKESHVQDSLKKLRRALELIQQIVVQGGQRGRLSLVCQNNELSVFERSSQTSCLPDDVMERFDV